MLANKIETSNEAAGDVVAVKVAEVVPEEVITGGDSTLPTEESIPERKKERQSLLDQVMRMRERSNSSTSRSISHDDASSIATTADDKGSIRIMLDGQDFEPDNDFHGLDVLPVSQTFSTATPEKEDWQHDSQLVDGSSSDEGTDTEADVIESAPETPRKAPLSSVVTSEAEETPRQMSKQRVSTQGVELDTEWPIRSSVLAPSPVQTPQDRPTQLSGLLTDSDETEATVVPRDQDITEPSTLDDPQHALEQSSQNEGTEYLPTTALQVTPGAEIEAVGQDHVNAPDSAAHVSNPEQSPLDEPSVDATPAVNGHVVDPTAKNQFREPASQPQDDPKDTTAGAEVSEQRPVPPPKDIGYSPRSSASYSLRTGSLDGRPPSPPSARVSKISDFQYLPEIEVGSGLGQGLGLNLEPQGASVKELAMPPPPNYTLSLIHI